MRLFVAVWPSADVVSLLSAVPRPELRGVRWTTPDQWHITLRFDGEVADVAEVEAALDVSLTGAAATTATAEGGVQRFGRGAVGLLVAGLEDLASRVDPSPSRRFKGHLTLARFRSGRHPPRVEPAPPPLSWPVTEVTLVRSQLGQDPARYEVVRRFPLGDA